MSKRPGLIPSFILLQFIPILFVLGCASTGRVAKMEELKTVDKVDLTRYMGTWYEIARYTQSFEKGLVAVTATYSVLPDGKVRVLNQGHQKTINGKLKTAIGKARVVDTSTNAKLKVTFFWPFSGDYWVIDLGSNYEYAVVGHPSRKYLWVLSRTPVMNESVYNGILDRIKAQGYDVSKLEKIPQK